MTTAAKKVKEVKLEDAANRRIEDLKLKIRKLGESGGGGGRLAYSFPRTDPFSDMNRNGTIASAAGAGIAGLLLAAVVASNGGDDGALRVAMPVVLDSARDDGEVA